MSRNISITDICRAIVRGWIESTSRRTSDRVMETTTGIKAANRKRNTPPRKLKSYRRFVDKILER